MPTGTPVEAHVHVHLCAHTCVCIVSTNVQTTLSHTGLCVPWPGRAPRPRGCLPHTRTEPTAGPLARVSSLSPKKPEQPGRHAGSCFGALSPVLCSASLNGEGRLMMCNCARKEAPRGALRSSGRHPAWHGAVRGVWVPIPQSEREIAKSWGSTVDGRDRSSCD